MAKTPFRLLPDSAKVYTSRGFVYKKMGRNRLAIEDLNEALRLKPNYAKAYALRGGIYLRLGKHKPGCEDVRNACELNFCHGLKRAQKKGCCR
jgi:regulator of sirC expression with transglutaminase-like and TPR domain